MVKKTIIVGEVHQDLFYKTNYFTRLAKQISSKIYSKYQTQDVKEGLTEEKLKEFVLKIINDTDKKIPGETFIKRGGNGNNSAMLVNNLGIPTQLMSTIGSGHEWILPEIRVWV